MLGEHLEQALERPEGRSSVFVEIIKFTILALLIVTPFRLFVAQPFIVSGASMVPTFKEHEYLVVDQLTYQFEKPQRGDVVIFRYPLEPDNYFIKRVVGVPGDEVEIKEGVVSVITKEGEVHEPLLEPYTSSDIVETENSNITLYDHEYFVMGDNRQASSDSRIWGPLSEQFIVGRAVARLFPFQKIEILPGEYNFEEVSEE